MCHSDSEEPDTVPTWFTQYLLDEHAPMPFPYRVSAHLKDLAKPITDQIARDRDSGSAYGAYWEGSRGVLTFNALHSEYLRKGHLRECLDLALWMYQGALSEQLRLYVSDKRPIEEARLHKGIFLYSIYQACEKLEWRWHARRYLLLAVIESLLTYVVLGQRDKRWEYYTDRTGSYRNLIEHVRVPTGEVLDLCGEIGTVLGCEKGQLPQVRDASGIHQLGANQTRGKRTWPKHFILFPEWLLGRLMYRPWFRCDPAATEINECWASPGYARHLWQLIKGEMKKELNDKKEKNLRKKSSIGALPAIMTTACELACVRQFERKTEEKVVRKDDYLEELAQHLMSCIPGFRTRLNLGTSRGELDVFVAREGLAHDFREECSRVIFCECKCKATGVSIQDLHAFSGKLRAAKAILGVLFCVTGPSGTDHGVFADEERKALWQREGIAVVDITAKDLDEMLSESQPKSEDSKDSILAPPGCVCPSPEADPEHDSRACNPLEAIRGKYEQIRMGLRTSKRRRGGEANQR